MKKIVSLIISAMLIILICGCNSKNSSEVTLAAAGYTCDSKVDFGDLSATAILNVTGGGIFVLEITSPESLKGLTFSFDNRNMSVSYGELKKDLSSVGEVSGFAELLDGVFLKLTTGSPTAVNDGGEYVFEGISDGYEFSVSVDENGYPIILTMPKAELTAEFSNWRY